MNWQLNHLSLGGPKPPFCCGGISRLLPTEYFSGLSQKESND